MKGCAFEQAQGNKGWGYGGEPCDKLQDASQASGKTEALLYVVLTTN